MIGDIEKLLTTQPFEPFTVVTSGGVRYRVASRDHITIGPKKTRIVILFDDDTGVFITGLHIASVETESPIPASPF